MKRGEYQIQVKELNENTLKILYSTYVDDNHELFLDNS